VDGSATLFATGGASSKPVVFKVDPSTLSGVCDVMGANGMTVIYTAPGTCVIDANQAGNSTYAAATQVTGSITVIADSYTVTFKANGGSGAMAPQTDSAPTTLTTNSFTRTAYIFTGWNTAANDTGTAYTNDAMYPFTASVTLFAQWVRQTSQTITFGTLANATLAQASVTVSADASSGLTVTFTTATSVVCIAGGTNGATITLLEAGKCIVQANQAGNATYSPARAVSRGFTVSEASQTITFATLAKTTFAQSSVTVSASASSGLAVTFTTTTSVVCIAGGTNGATITLLEAGKCIVQANQAGNATYSPARAVSRSFTVTQ